MDRFDRDVGKASDDDLVRWFVEGDEAAFAELMHRHEDRMFAMTYRITGDRGDALEATQEAFISLFRRAASFRGESAFSTWLYRIGMNAAYDIVRKRKATPELHPERQEDLPSPSAAAMEDAAGIRSDVAEALARIPTEYREAVVMHDLADISYDDIASLLGVSLGTVKSRISRGRRRLAELLEPSYRAQPSKDQQ
jgi:RNA polymerase sigma-70 factor, ECF subfamily